MMEILNCRINEPLKMKKLLKKIFVSLVVYPFLYIHDSWPIWFYVLNRQGKKAYRQNPPANGLLEKRIVADLQSEGIALTNLEELFPKQNVLVELQAYVEKLLPTANPRKDKPFLLQINEYSEVIDFHNPFVRLALKPVVLAIVNGYMNMYAKFHYYSVAAAIPVDEGTVPLKSQRWHRDFDDKKTCKMFIYLSDVDEGSGPFMYIRETQYGARNHKKFPPVPSQGAYPPMEEVARVFSKDEIQICTGKAGTVIFADTRGLHRGGFASKNRRIMFTAEYASEGAFLPVRYQLSANFEKEIGKLNPPAFFAIKKEDFLTRTMQRASLLAMRLYQEYKLKDTSNGYRKT